MNASKDTLVKRSKYGGRKARRAIARLWTQFNTTVSWVKEGYQNQQARLRAKR